jgi:dolichol-phosphate mannosyltransferase
VNKKCITIVTPVYNEEENIDNYYNEICLKLLTLSQYEFEIIFVDDGSHDNSWEKILKICNENTNFNAIRLSRNFSSHFAITAGLDRAKGDAAIILACDLQDPVETAIEFIRKWEKGYKIVWGERISRDDANWKIIASKLFNLLLKKWAMPENSNFTTGSFLLIDRKVLDCYCMHDDNSRLTFAIVAWTGFKQVRIPYHRQARKAGKTGWSFLNMISGFYNAIIAYSTFPLKFITTISIFILFFSVPIALYITYLYTVGRTGNIGWISTILAVFLFSGIILFQLSIISVYLSRIYKDASNRPLYFVSDDTIPERYTISRPMEKSKSK